MTPDRPYQHLDDVELRAALRMGRQFDSPNVAELSDELERRPLAYRVADGGRYSIWLRPTDAPAECVYRSDDLAKVNRSFDAHVVSRGPLVEIYDADDGLVIRSMVSA